MFNFNYTDKAEYYGELTLIPKEVISPLCFDNKVRGSEIRASVSASSFCRLTLDYLAEEQKMHCQKVLDAQKEYLDAVQIHKLHVREKADQKLLDEEAVIVNQKKNAYLDLAEKNCAGCKNYQQMIHPTTIKANKYNRFGTKREQIAYIKTLLTLYLLVRSDVPKEGSEKIFKSPTKISMREIVKISDLSPRAVMYSLEKLRDEGIISYANCDRGVYWIMFTPDHDALKYKNAREGGAGYIAFPFGAIKYLLSLRKIDSIRVALLLFLDMDDRLLRGEYTPYDIQNGKGIEFNSSYLQFVQKHENASMKNIIDRFTEETNRILGEVFFLNPVANFISDEYKGKPLYNDGRYRSIRVSWPMDLAPKQYDYTVDTTNPNVPVPVRDLVREISKPAKKEAFAALNYLTGSLTETKNGYRGHIFTDEEIGYLIPGMVLDRRAYKPSEREVMRNITLIPALTTVSQHIGNRYIKESMIATLEHFKEEFKAVTKAVSESIKNLEIKNYSESEPLKEIMQRMQAYMIASAHSLKEQFLSNWRALEYDIITGGGQIFGLGYEN